MADKTPKTGKQVAGAPATPKEVQDARDKGEPVPISAADDGVVSRLHDRYEDNPDKPDPSSVAQVQVLKDSES